MRIKFNPTGTHTHKGLLKVRVDLFPDKRDKTYTLHHIYYQDETSREFLRGYEGKLNIEGSPIDQVAYNDWWDNLPKVWKTNPCLCHFIKVNPDVSLPELGMKVKAYFNAKTLLDLDDALSKSDTSRVGQIMRTKLGDGRKVAQFTEGDKSNLNSRLSLMEIRG